MKTKKKRTSRCLAAREIPERAKWKSPFLYDSTFYVKNQEEDRKMSLEQMRAAVIALSPHWEWEKRVHQMPDRQVVAIYHNRVLRQRARGRT